MKCQREGCNKQARRKFCSNKCKDRFHNMNNPRGKFAHLDPRDDYFDITEGEHPSSDGAIQPSWRL